MYIPLGKHCTYTNREFHSQTGSGTTIGYLTAGSHLGLLSYFVLRPRVALRVQPRGGTLKATSAPVRIRDVEQATAISSAIPISAGATAVPVALSQEIRSREGEPGEQFPPVTLSVSLLGAVRLLPTSSPSTVVTQAPHGRADAANVANGLDLLQKLVLVLFRLGALVFVTLEESRAYLLAVLFLQLPRQDEAVQNIV